MPLLSEVTETLDALRDWETWKMTGRYEGRHRAVAVVEGLSFPVIIILWILAVILMWILIFGG
jgi:hypothetical protein